MKPLLEKHDGSDVMRVMFKELRIGDVLLDGLCTKGGAIIITAGMKLTVNKIMILGRLTGYDYIKEPIKIRRKK